MMRTMSCLGDEDEDEDVHCDVSVCCVVIDMVMTLTVCVHVCVCMSVYVCAHVFVCVCCLFVCLQRNGLKLNPEMNLREGGADAASLITELLKPEPSE